MLVLDTKRQSASLVRDENGMAAGVDVPHELLNVAAMLGAISGH